MSDRKAFYINRLREKLWVKPLLSCVLSVGAVLTAGALDVKSMHGTLPRIDPGTNTTLLSIMASSMLVIATFTVGSMVSAYASASNAATPRSFPLIIADDVTQNALSTFIGAFIFSIVALVALTNGTYNQTGQFIVFALTMSVFAWVVLTFVRWVDTIARLGRLGNTISKVEQAAAKAIQKRRRNPTLCGKSRDPQQDPGDSVYGNAIGYVQHVDMEALQQYADESDTHISIAALPGAFAAPGNALAYVKCNGQDSMEVDTQRVADAFLIGDHRVYDEDPRFGLIVLSEIASRALSPAVNDPGTAISVIGTLVRLFSDWSRPLDENESPVEHDRIHVPEISTMDLFDDAFTSIARDGARSIEVAIRLQKAFAALVSMGHSGIAQATRHHSERALAFARCGLELKQDFELVQAAASRVEEKLRGDGSQEK
jgi:uncharacterized membrane protein